MASILLIEDEEGLREVIRLNLDLEGYEVFAAPDAKNLDNFFKKGKFDLVLLDIMMPDIDGFEACRMIRARDPEVPVIFITARGAGEDRIKGLKTGADDYLAKPFHLEELILRIKNLLKRTENGRIKDVFDFDGNRIDFARYVCIPAGNEPVAVNRREIELLRILTENREKVVSRDEILEALWPDANYPSPRVIDNYILNFRKIFENKRLKTKYFHSIRGVGYKFSPLGKA